MGYLERMGGAAGSGSNAKEAGWSAETNSLIILSLHLSNAANEQKSCGIFPVG